MHKFYRFSVRCYATVIKSPLSSKTQHLTPAKFNVHEQIWSGLNDYGDRIALSCTQTGRSMKYSCLKQLSTNMAYWLQVNNTSVEHNSAEVATVLPNSIELAISALAALEAGVPIELLNPEYTSDELSKALAVGKPKFVITTSDRVHTILEAMSLSGNTVQIVTVDDDVVFNNVMHFEELVRTDGQPSLNFGKHGGIVMYNDGEARKISEKNIIANCIQLTQPELSPIEAGDKMAAVIPLWNCHGLTQTLLRGLRSGAEIVIMPPLMKMSHILNAVNKNKVTVLPTLSSMIDWLAQCNKQALAGLKCITVSGRPSSYSGKLQTVFRGEILNSYGPAEGPLLFQQRRGSTCRAGSVGQLLPNTEARVTAPEGNDLQHNIIGEIWVRGPQLGDGELWTSTGDQGYYDQDGWFYITDQSEMNVDGLKVSATELESVLVQHEGVAKAVVFPYDKQLVAAVIPKDPYQPPTCKELNLHLGTKLAPYKHIRDVVIMSSLPKDHTGQVDRKNLSKNYNPTKEFAALNFV